MTAIWPSPPHHRRGKTRVKEANLVVALRDNQSPPRKPHLDFQDNTNKHGRGKITKACPLQPSPASESSLGHYTDFNRNVDASYYPTCLQWTVPLLRVSTTCSLNYMLVLLVDRSPVFCSSCQKTLRSRLYNLHNLTCKGGISNSHCAVGSITQRCICHWRKGTAVTGKKYLPYAPPPSRRALHQLERLS